MINKRTRHKIKQLFIVFLALAFIGVLALVLIKQRTVLSAYESVMEENKLLLTGVNMVYLIDNNSYVNISSKKAYVDILQKSVDMEDVVLNYAGDETQVEASADNGVYELERIFRAYGNVKGKMSGMNFVTRPEGKLVYDYKTGLGDVYNGVTMVYGDNTIDSDSATFDTNSNYIRFDDNITVDYQIKTK